MSFSYEFRWSVLWESPHGSWILEGDPNQIDGLRLVHKDELADARAGPAP